MTTSSRTEERVLQFETAVPLVASLVARRADRANIRAIFIKGPFLAAQGIRDPKVSVDLDVLVHPAEMDRFIALLGKDGWYPRESAATPHSFDEHSVTMLHPYWPCMIDVHLFWVGFLRPAPDVFDALWQRRESVQIAESAATTTDVSVAALLLALNELRSAPEGAIDGRLDDLSCRVQGLLGEDAAAELESAARLVGAEHTAAPFLARVGVNVAFPEEPSPELRDWLLRQEVGDESTAGWLYRLERTPWLKKPAVLIDALAVRPSTLRALRPDAAPGFFGFWRAWFRRLRKGLSHLRKARVELDSSKRPGPQRDE